MVAGKPPTQRQLRVGEEIRHALARLLAEENFRDPVLRDVSITVSEVVPGRDLKTAKAFVYPLGGRSADEVTAALNRAAPFLRGRLGREVRLKFTPQLVFHADRSYDTASAVDALLTDDRVARDLAVGDLTAGDLTAGPDGTGDGA
ncbi:MAG: 30S ribosome-binding factor RbfA [Rhodospirillaceae bacterium]|nr:30S ribosome-binding factor RbfA [Rhodospirillaceae bacterium]MDE0253746.1 30S ribosome-binding factor RbfA [Rhodospirillaceae bacterium]MDE0618558.1 30S ribosome-binding factor RbfA [Rhodospirillaceae bacterium]MDE0716608.1 30S ribosome-binding factor RbfA [Rhodospirillaceae bacterium]